MSMKLQFLHMQLITLFTFSFLESAEISELSVLLSQSPPSDLSFPLFPSHFSFLHTIKYRAKSPVTKSPISMVTVCTVSVPMTPEQLHGL